MSQITTAIDQFRQGRISRDVLVRALTTFPYGVPERMQRHGSHDAYENEARVDAASPYTDGTWDEVARAYYRGELPKDVYDEVVRQLTAASG